MKAVFVDDSVIVLETFKRLMEEIAKNYALESLFVSDPVWVNRMIEEETLDCDILFVDINMPMYDGYTLAKKAKSKEKFQNLPIVAITTEYTQEAKNLGQEAGIDAWLIKTIAHDSLLNSIDQLLYKAKYQ